MNKYAKPGKGFDRKAWQEYYGPVKGNNVAADKVCKLYGEQGAKKKTAELKSKPKNKTYPTQKKCSAKIRKQSSGRTSIASEKELMCLDYDSSLLLMSSQKRNSQLRTGEDSGNKSPGSKVTQKPVYKLPRKTKSRSRDQPGTSYWVDHDDSYLLEERTKSPVVANAYEVIIRMGENEAVVRDKTVDNEENSAQSIELLAENYAYTDSNSSIVTNYRLSDSRCWDIEGTRYDRLCSASCDCKTHAFQQNVRENRFKLAAAPDVSKQQGRKIPSKMVDTEEFRRERSSDMKKIRPCLKYSNKYLNTACICDSVTLLKKKVVKRPQERVKQPVGNIPNMSLTTNTKHAARKKVA